MFSVLECFFNLSQATKQKYKKRMLLRILIEEDESVNSHSPAKTEEDYKKKCDLMDG